MQQQKRHLQQSTRSRYPVKILQFGSSDFLLGFADWMVQVANEKAGFNAGICVVQGISNTNILDRQEGIYKVVLKGIREEEFINQHYKIDSIQRVVNPNDDFDSFLNEAVNPDLQFIISNTTESMVAFTEQDAVVDTMASTFPGKLTQLLYHRFVNKLNNSLLILPTEQVDYNGAKLKIYVQKYCQYWHLPPEFNTWLTMRVTFCNSLVDRIVSGYPQKSNGSVFAEHLFDDGLTVEGEWFHLWVIEGPRWMEEVLPLRKAGLNVIYTDDLAPYQLRKIRILNGASTCMAYLGLLAGLQTIREAIEHPVIGRFIKRMIYDDIVPVIPGDLTGLEKYAEEVIDRLRNPAFDHQLAAVSAHSFSKFGVSVLPTLLTQVDKNGTVHDRLVYSLAALIFYYRPSSDGVGVLVEDSEEVKAFMQAIWKGTDYSKSGMEERCRKVLSDQKSWGRTLANVPELVERMGQYLYSIDQVGVIESLREL